MGHEYAARQQFYNRLRAIRHVHSVHDLPAVAFPTVMAMVAEVERTNQAFIDWLHEMQTEYIQQYIRHWCPLDAGPETPLAAAVPGGPT